MVGGRIGDGGGRVIPGYASRRLVGTVGTPAGGVGVAFGRGGTTRIGGSGPSSVSPWSRSMSKFEAAGGTTNTVAGAVAAGTTGGGPWSVVENPGMTSLPRAVPGTTTSEPRAVGAISVTTSS